MCCVVLVFKPGACWPAPGFLKYAFVHDIGVCVCVRVCVRPCVRMCVSLPQGYRLHSCDILNLYNQ